MLKSFWDSAQHHQFRTQNSTRRLRALPTSLSLQATGASQLKGLSAAIEPVLIVCVGGMVLILALGIFLPLWDMIGTAAKG